MSAITPLRAKKDFDLLFGSSQYRHFTERFLILSVANDCGRPRLGTIMAKKKVRQAVTRNLVKRHVREFLRLHPLAYDYLLVARKKIDHHEKKKLSKRFATCSEKCNAAKSILVKT